MKTLSIEIDESIYNDFVSFLNILPKKKVLIIDEEDDILTLEERDEVYRIKAKTDKGDYSEFENWDDVKDQV